MLLLESIDANVAPRRRNEPRRETRMMHDDRRDDDRSRGARRVKRIAQFRANVPTRSRIEIDRRFTPRRERRHELYVTVISAKRLMARKHSGKGEREEDEKERE